MGSQFQLVNHVVKVVQEQGHHLFVFLENGGLVNACLFLRNKPLQLQFQNQVNGLLLFLCQWIRSRYLFNHVIVLPDNYGNLVFLVSPLVSRIWWPGSSLALRGPSVARYLFVCDHLLSLLFCLFWKFFVLLGDLSFGAIAVLGSFGLFWLLGQESVDVFSQALSSAHLIFPHEVWKVLQKLRFHLVKLQFRDLIFISEL